MPVIIVNMIEGRTKKQKQALVKELTEVTCRTIETSKEKVKIIINEISKDNYAIAGQLLIDANKR